MNLCFCINSKCNRGCRQCSFGSKPDGCELDPEDLQIISDQVNGMLRSGKKIATVHFTGDGEPLMTWFIPQVVANFVGVATKSSSIITSGPENAEELERFINIVRILEEAKEGRFFSIYGPTEAVIARPVNTLLALSVYDNERSRKRISMALKYLPNWTTFRYFYANDHKFSYHAGQLGWLAKELAKQGYFPVNAVTTGEEIEEVSCHEFLDPLRRDMFMHEFDGRDAFGYTLEGFTIVFRNTEDPGKYFLLVSRPIKPWGRAVENVFGGHKFFGCSLMRLKDERRTINIHHDGLPVCPYHGKRYPFSALQDLAGQTSEICSDLSKAILTNPSLDKSDICKLCPLYWQEGGKVWRPS